MTSSHDLIARPHRTWRSGFGLRTALGQRAAMVTVDAGNPGVYGYGTCADDATHRFLHTGRLPMRDRFCPGPSPDDIATLAPPAGPPLPPAGPLAWAPDW